MFCKTMLIVQKQLCLCRFSASEFSAHLYYRDVGIGKLYLSLIKGVFLFKNEALLGLNMSAGVRSMAALPIQSFLK